MTQYVCRWLPLPATFNMVFVRNDLYLLTDCAVCEKNYGRGAGRSCHKCTTKFLIVMYCLLTTGLALTIILGGLLTVYLVRRRVLDLRGEDMLGMLILL